MDKIFLHGMKVETLVGVYTWERQQKQTLILDLTIGVAKKSGANDDIVNTVSYADVHETVCACLAEQQFLLLEALAEYVAGLVLSQFNALWIRVRVIKPGILPKVAEVGVEIERSVDEMV